MKNENGALFCDHCQLFLARLDRYRGTIFWDSDQKRQIDLHEHCYERYKQHLIDKERA